MAEQAIKAWGGNGCINCAVTGRLWRDANLYEIGAGYSSLGLLSRLPVDILKIDRSFISGLPGDPACVALTTSIIQLAKAFGLETIAEGVETAEQLALLRELRCGQSQGFLYSSAVPGAQIESILASAALTEHD